MFSLLPSVSAHFNKSLTDSMTQCESNSSDADECLSGSSVHYCTSLVAARKAVVTHFFLFVWQEGELLREQSEGSKDFTHPDTAACTTGRLHTGRRQVQLPQIWVPYRYFSISWLSMKSTQQSVSWTGAVVVYAPFPVLGKVSMCS